MLGTLAKTFFHPSRIHAAAARAERKTGYRLGAYLRTVARNLVRRKKKPSAPGRPPAAHAPGGSGLKHILYNYDPAIHLTIVGVVKHTGQASTLAGKASPGFVEAGGSAVMTTRRRGKPTLRRRVKMQPRPFMSVALKRTVPKIPPAWAGTVHSL